MSRAGETITVSLSRNDFGQILDALCVRRDDWRYTQRYLEEGHEEGISTRDRLVNVLKWCKIWEERAKAMACKP